MELLWIFLIFTALQPAIARKMLEITRQRLIRSFESRRGSRVILLVHRQETMGFLGIPLVRYIDIQDSEAVLRAIQLTDDNVPLDIVLHTPGGLVLAALQIARALQYHPAKVTVYIPHYAMSGGTLIALAADEIVMCRHSVLGPVDPQIDQFPAGSLLKVVDEKPVEMIDDTMLILADQARKAVHQVQRAVFHLLEKKMGEEKADDLSKILTAGTWTHDYPITIDIAREMGLNVKTDMPTEILELMNLYPQPVRQQSPVEYLPGPKYKKERGKS